MNKKKPIDFLHHPVVLKQTNKKLPQPSPIQFSIEFEQEKKIQQSLKDLKKTQINEKITYLQNLRLANKTLNSQIQSLESNFSTIQQKQKRHFKSLKHKLYQLDTEIENCHQVEKVEALEFLQWQNREVIKKHKERMQQLQQKYSIERQKKNSAINELKQQIEDVMINIRKLEKLIQQQQNVVIPTFNQPEIVMPNLRMKNTELGHIKEKIQSLKENKKLLITEIKQQLNANTWKVKDTFQNSKEKITRQMRRLLNYLDRPDKEIIKNISSPQKIPNPITLIENYENRLQQLQDSLPTELKTDQILKCLKPLPWRNIKGISFQPLSATLKTHDRYHKLQKQYQQLQAKNAEYRAELKQRQNDIIEKYNKKISEFDSRIKDLS